MNNSTAKKELENADLTALRHRAMKLKYSMLYLGNVKNIKSNLQMFVMDEV